VQRGHPRGRQRRRAALVDVEAGVVNVAAQRAPAAVRTVADAVRAHLAELAEAVAVGDRAADAAPADPDLPAADAVAADATPTDPRRPADAHAADAKSERAAGA